MQKKLIISVLIWLTGTSIVIFSIGGIFSLSIGAALGPVESTWYIASLVSCFIGAALVLYAYYKAAFVQRWVKVTVLIIFILPIGGLGILTGLQAIYITAMPVFEKIAVIKREVLVDKGWHWHFVNSSHYFSISNEKTYKCVKNLGTKKTVAILEVTLHYGTPSYFRALKFGECKVDTPIKNPNTIVPEYMPGEEKMTTHNKALQLIHKSGAPIGLPLLLSAELNRYRS